MTNNKNIECPNCGRERDCEENCPSRNIKVEKQFYKEIECTDTQNHLKECKECSGGEWEEEFDEEIRTLIYTRPQTIEEAANNVKIVKKFISKVAKTERAKYPEGYQGKE